MSTSQDRDCERYEIRVKGHLDTRAAAWFEGMSLTNESDGTTNIHGPVVDQAALHGLLQKLRECTHRQELRRLSPPRPPARRHAVPGEVGDVVRSTMCPSRGWIRC